MNGYKYFIKWQKQGKLWYKEWCGSLTWVKSSLTWLFTVSQCHLTLKVGCFTGMINYQKQNKNLIQHAAIIIADYHFVGHSHKLCVMLQKQYSFCNCARPDHAKYWSSSKVFHTFLLLVLHRLLNQESNYLKLPPVCFFRASCC